ncbi:FxsA family protein [Nocardioides sp.]|uniref:FxsA family protein n=1 Tax=Nocardioides sp. TaxID=35761 RepID=UPI003D0AC228
MSTRRRRIPLWVAFLLFLAVPLLEIWVLIQVGQVIGAWWTILLLIADSIFGAWLIKREGSRAWRSLNTALSSGKMPARELADGALILIGGTLMLAPGFVTDAFGILIILPFTRPVFRALLTGVVTRKLLASGFPGVGFPGQDAQRPGPGSQSGSVVQGEVVDEGD